MKIWIDAQLSPAIASWISDSFEDIEALPVKSLGLRDAEDYEIFKVARKENAIILSKDEDFIRLNEQHGSLLKIIWLTCGNTSNEKLKQILSKTLIEAVKLLQGGEAVVEISDE